MINTLRDFYLSLDDFNIKTGFILCKPLALNFKYTIKDDDHQLQLAYDALLCAICKHGDDLGFNGSNFGAGALGFDTNGNSTLDHTIGFSDNKVLAEKSFKAGRKFAISINFNPENIFKSDKGKLL